MKIKIQKLLFLKIHLSSNLPAPINVGSLEQTKTGNLIIEGVLRLGQFASAPSGTEGALYYDTTENITKIYSSSAWGDLGGGAEPGQLPTYTTAERDALSPTAGLQIYNTTENNVQLYSQTAWKTVGAKLALAATCSLDGDCDSTHCVDGYCCDTGCTGNCNRCNVVDSIGVCTEVASDCTGNCVVCSLGNCTPVADNCTGDCAVCSGSGTEYNCAASEALCIACYHCTGSDTSYNCGVMETNWGADLYSCTGDTNRCYGGSCVTCGGWMNYGYCWYNGTEGGSCTTACSSRGGVYNDTCDWINTVDDCSTCKHFYPSASTWRDTNSGPLYSGTAHNYCYSHLAGYSMCDYTYPTYTHQCACNK